MAVLALVLALVGGVHKRHVEITSLDFDWTSAHDWELAQQLVGVRRKHKQDAAKLESWRTVSCSGRDKCELSVLHAQQQPRPVVLRGWRRSRSLAQSD